MGFSVLPKATQFFDMFARAGANAVEAARLVEQRFVDPSVVKHSQVKALEHVGDNMTGEIITLLNTQYVTPFDREDIYGLASATDDVLWTTWTMRPSCWTSTGSLRRPTSRASSAR